MARLRLTMNGFIGSSDPVRTGCQGCQGLVPAGVLTAARLQHPNIVAIQHVGEQVGQPLFSMDYGEGQNLADFARDPPLTVRQAERWLKILSQAVHHSREQGLKHRDLKPSNSRTSSRGNPP